MMAKLWAAKEAVLDAAHASTIAVILAFLKSPLLPDSVAAVSATAASERERAAVAAAASARRAARPPAPPTSGNGRP